MNNSRTSSFDDEANTSKKELLDDMKHEHFYDGETRKKRTTVKISKSTAMTKMSHYINSAKYRMKRHYFKTKETDFASLPIHKKIFFILIDLPFNVLRDLTIPSCELDTWNRTFFVFMPLTSTVFVILITTSWDIFFDNLILLICTIVIIVVLIFVLRYNVYRNRIPKNLVILCIFAFIMAIFWIWMAAKVLIDLLTTLGDILDVPATFLGITLLAIGNSAADLSLNVALAKTGYGEMGVAGSVAGPLFNLLIGLGTGLLKTTIESGSIHFNLFLDDKRIVFVCVITLMLNLVRLLVQGFLLKFDLQKSVSYIGWLLYLAFVGVIIYFSFFTTQSVTPPEN